MMDAQFCRQQAETHQAKAEAAALPNVRSVALAAVECWTREAEFADMVAARRKREAAELEARGTSTPNRS
jgi:hypothetical protein